MKYKILRPTLWFCKGDEVEVSKMYEYFTAQGIKELIQYGYLQIFEK